MKLALLLLLLIAGAIALAVLKRQRVGGGDSPWPFYAKKPLSPPEQVLYHRLVEALPTHIVLAQVQLSRILGVKKGFNFHQWNNRINRMSVDFVVCRKDSTIVAAIELDDKSHEKEDRIKADGKKDKALTDAGVTVIRWQANAMPDADAIRAKVIAPSATPATA